MTNKERKQKKKEYQKRYRQNPDVKIRNKEYSKKYWAEHLPKLRECQRKDALRKQYNISVDEWQILFEKQQGRCAVCGIHQSELRKRLGVDHNHLTGEIRGLLCDDCNMGLGRLKTDYGGDILKKALEYIGDK